MTQREPAVEAWFRAHDDYHRASAVYNERLILIRAERERDNWTMNCHQEYAALHEAQSAALKADETLYSVLLSDGEEHKR